MEVKYLDLQAQFKGNRKIRAIIDDLFSSCYFVGGPQVEELEKNFAELCGTQYAVALSNGTDALCIALKILGIGEGDEVITAPNSFLATAGAIVQAGAFPRFVDIGPDYNIDPGKIEAAINDKTRAIMPVHLTGNPAPMDEIQAIAHRHGLHIVEDACQSVDASYKGKKTGNLGDMAGFSLHPLKNLNTCGDGGLFTTNDSEYYSKALLYRNHGLMNRNESAFFAYNNRLDSLKAAVANAQIEGIGEVTAKRNETAAKYDAAFSSVSQLIIPPRKDRIRQAFHTYVIQTERRDELISYLEERGIETKIHYPIPIHLMKAASGFGYRKGDFPICESQAKKIISLPVHIYLTDKQIEYVIECVTEFHKQ